MIPLGLAITIIKSKSSVPFPTFIEVLLMLFAFELVTEAGLRLPKAIGQAVSSPSLNTCPILICV